MHQPGHGTNRQKGVGAIMNKAVYSLALAGLLLVGCIEPVEPAELETVPEKECLGSFEVTAYCPCNRCCGAWADGIVYTGGYATEGQTIAVDPDIIPLGSVVEINGWQYIAEDIGGAIKGNKIDLFFCSHTDALNYGVQQHEVYLVK